MIGYLYSIIASFLIGIQLFSVKLMSVYPEYFYTFILFSVIVLILSRICIYYAMNKLDAYLVHTILTLSVVFTIIFSFYLFGIKNFNFTYFIIGLFLLISGIILIQLSH